MLNEMQELYEGLEEYLYENEVSLEEEDSVITISLDYFDGELYSDIMYLVESYFMESDYVIEEFNIDGDYESSITITYI